MSERDLGVERHDVVETIIGVAVLALGVVHQSLEAESAQGRFGQRKITGQVKAVECRGCVDVFQDHELIACRGVGRPGADRVHHHPATCATLSVDVVGDIGVERRDP